MHKLRQIEKFYVLVRTQDRLGGSESGVARSGFEIRKCAVEKRRISSHTNVLKRTKSRINSRLQLLVTQQTPKYFSLSKFAVQLCKTDITFLLMQGEEMAVQNNQEDTLNITVEFS